MRAKEKDGRSNQSKEVLIAGSPGGITRRTPYPVLTLREVIKKYQTGVGGFTAINGVSLEIFPGEFVGIIGKSGAGKTTLLNMISGVSEISSGEVLFTAPNRGKPEATPAPISVHSLNENQLALWRGRNLGIVYQSFELMPQLDLVDNIMLSQDFTGRYQPTDSRERAFRLLEMVELTEHANKKPAQISGGQKQRIAIARALVNDPPVVLADEPTGNLDSVTAETIFRIFEKLVGAGKTVVMVTHDLSLASRFSRWVQLADGEIVANSRVPALHPVSVVGDPPGNGDSPRWVLDQTSDITMGSGSGSTNGKIEAGRFRVGAAAEIPAGGPVNQEFFAGEVAKISLSRGGYSGDHDQTGADDQPAILLRDVVKTYVNAAGEFPALRGIDLRIDYGQFVSLIGKSGSGKSTLLNMLTGIDHPTSGEVIIGGQPIYEMSESKRALWRGQNVGIVFQFFQLLPTLTLLENTLLPMDYCNRFPMHEREGRAMALLEKVGLENEAYKLPSAVSSGQQQSAAIARALANDPPIIVADEPTGNLDSRAADVILRLFNDLAGQGKTILIVTHDPSFTGQTERTVILSDGEFVDETVARTLPFLDHPQMLAVSRQITYLEMEPGATILHKGEPAAGFFMIAQGEVEVLAQNGRGAEQLIARLGPGEYFGGSEFMEGGGSIAVVRAGGDSPIRMAVLERDWQFQHLHGPAHIPPALNEAAMNRLKEFNSRPRGR